MTVAPYLVLGHCVYYVLTNLQAVFPVFSSCCPSGQSVFGTLALVVAAPGVLADSCLFMGGVGLHMDLDVAWCVSLYIPGSAQ